MFRCSEMTGEIQRHGVGKRLNISTICSSQELRVEHRVRNGPQIEVAFACEVMLVCSSSYPGSQQANTLDMRLRHTACLFRALFGVYPCNLQ